jgi:hypothetical protein
VAPLYRARRTSAQALTASQKEEQNITSPASEKHEQNELKNNSGSQRTLLLYKTTMQIFN